MSHTYSSTIRVAVVVLNWNGLSDTLDCLTSLVNMKTSFGFGIIVIDNNSSEPNTSKKLNEFSNLYNTVQVIFNSRNDGFAGGVNIGINLALKQNYTHIALLNNDAVVERSWLEVLVNAFSNGDKVGIVTGCLLHADGETIDSSGEQYTNWGLPFPRSRNISVTEVPESGFTFGATGGASLYARELFEDIGLFDPAFFAYYEDVDVSFRSQLAGWKVYFEPRAIAYHKQGATSSKIPGFAVMQTMKNLPLLFIKNVPTSMLLSIGIRFWLAYTLILGKALLSSNFVPALKGYGLGIWYFWTHALPKRFSIQRSKAVSDSVIREMLVDDLPPDQTGLRRIFRKGVR